MVAMEIERMIKFLLVVCCFLNTFVAKNGLTIDKRDQAMLKIGMGLTVAADFCLVIMGINVFGILIFCAVQAVYNYRYTSLPRVKIQVIVGAAVFIGALLVTGFDIIFAAGSAYGIFIIYSLSGALMARSKYPAPNDLLIIAGMILFFLCDIFVMISSLPIQEIYGEWAFEFVNRGIWICYLPAQVMLSSSARKVKSVEE